MGHDFSGAGSSQDNCYDSPSNRSPSYAHSFSPGGHGTSGNYGYERQGAGSPTPLNDLARVIHTENGQWWNDLNTGERLNRNKGELLMLIVSEVAEAMEGERKDLMDTHLTHRKMAEVELADVLIRVLDYAGAFGYDLDGAVAEKRTYNDNRADHKREARLAAGGKKF